ncbi:hypothetical protein [Jutongia sp.]
MKQFKMQIVNEPDA